MDSKAEYKHAEVTEQIIRAFYTVYNTLGYGFLERVYVKALLLELKKLGLAVGHEVAIEVLYSGEVIGEYFADLIVNGVVIVEVKAARILAEEHEAQLLDYLKATGFEVGLHSQFRAQSRNQAQSFRQRSQGPFDLGCQVLNQPRLLSAFICEICVQARSSICFPVRAILMFVSPVVGVSSYPSQLPASAVWHCRFSSNRT